MNNFSMNVSQSKVTSCVSIREPLVIKTELVKHGCMNVMHVDGVLFCFPSGFICAAVNRPALNTTAGHPNRESIVVVVAAKLLAGVQDRTREFR